MKIQTESLRGAIELASKFSETSTSLDQRYKGIQFKKVGDTKLAIAGSNFNSYVVISGLEVDSWDGLPSGDHFFVETSVVSKVVGAASNPFVEIDWNEATNQLEFETGAHYKINYFKSEVSFDPETDLTWKSMTISEVLSAINKLRLFSAEDTMSLELSGVYFGKGYAYGFNGFEGIRVSNVPDSIDACFSTDPFSALSKMDATVSIEVAVSPNRIYFRQGSILVAGLLFSKNYPHAQIDDMLTESQSSEGQHFGLRSGEIKQAIIRGSLFAKESSKIAELRYKDVYNLTISVVDVENNQRVQQNLMLQEGHTVKPDFAIRLGLDFLGHVLQVCEQDTLIDFVFSNGIVWVGKDKLVTFSSVRRSEA